MAEQAGPPGGRGRAGRRFAVVLCSGLALAGLGAVAASRPWFAGTASGEAALAVRPGDLQADMPLAAALSLVVLAAWGAVAVSRLRGRRVALAIGMLAELGVAASLIAAPLRLPEQIRDAAGAEVPTAVTGWLAVAVVSAVGSLAALATAWRAAPRWPVMSSRYEAPGTAPAADELSWWKALDAGLDPTAADPRGGQGDRAP